MYLTYGITKRELIDCGSFVYYNEYIVIMNDEKNDFAETHLNEDA